MVVEEATPAEVAADCPYINDYCRERHRSVVRCGWTSEKGRILKSQKAFKQGDVIFREPPLHIVAEQAGNEAFVKLKELCASIPQVFEYEPLWYWTALCSLKKSQLAPTETRLKPISEDQQRKLFLLYHSEVKEASEASKQLVLQLGLAPRLEPLDLERLLQIWILNCFEHSDEPLGYSTYFMSSFMSHSCVPNAVWHYDGDDFILRARCAIEEEDEISVSYLSEDALLESTPARRKHLQDSKHFVCTCVRCSAAYDMSRGFRCPACREGTVYRAGAGSGDAKELTGTCEHCQHTITKAEAALLVEEEKYLEAKLDCCERDLEKKRKPKTSPEEALVRAERSLWQHWLLDKAWSLAAEYYDRNERQGEAETLMSKRIAFQEKAYPGLSGARAWTLETYVDMLLRHHGASVDPSIKLPNPDVAKLLAPVAPPAYATSLQILSLMFGEKHEYFTCVERKATELRTELERLLGSGRSIFGHDSSSLKPSEGLSKKGF